MPASVILGRSIVRAVCAGVAGAISFFMASGSGLGETWALAAAVVVSLLVGRAIRFAMLTPEERRQES